MKNNLYSRLRKYMRSGHVLVYKFLKVIDSNSHSQVGVCELKKFNLVVLHGPANSTDMS